MAAATQTGRFTATGAGAFPTQNTAGFFQCTASFSADTDAASAFTVAHGLGAIPDFVFHNCAISSAVSTNCLLINIQRDSANISATNSGLGACAEVEIVAGIILSSNR